MSGETSGSAAPVSVGVERVNLETDAGILENEERRWGAPLKDTYRQGLRFFKEMEGKALQLSYEDRLRLVAYTQQTVHGPLDDKTSPPPGVLDVIGRDRRAAWLALKDMSKVQAMANFLHTLDRLCPMFKTYMEAVHKNDQEKQSQQKYKQQQEEEKKAQEMTDRLQENEEEDSVKRIKEALNAQTYAQFVEYAQQQFPGSVEQQAVLVRQLQEQHYRQYVQQLALDSRLASVKLLEKEPENIIEKEMQDKVDKSEEENTSEEDNNTDRERETEHDESDDGLPPVEEARMWTRTDVAEFKGSVVAAGSGGVVTVGHGETVTVRVPTHRAGRCLYWEFATDGFDLGFGVYFEWGAAASCEVTVLVSESEDDDDDDDADDNEDVSGGGDLEVGSGSRGRLTSQPRPVSVVVPIYRRDSHLEVYAGSHTYPGEGVYLLKFDNTYSLWRSKTLYYRVYYTH